MRFGSERPAPLETLSLVVERPGVLFVATRGVSSARCFTASELVSPDGNNAFSPLLSFRVPPAPGFEL
jgi:hypothetical protein